MECMGLASWKLTDDLLFGFVTDHTGRRYQPESWPESYNSTCTSRLRGCVAKVLSDTVSQTPPKLATTYDSDTSALIPANG